MRYLAALLVLIVCVSLGDLIKGVTGLPVSGPVLGLVILLAGLMILGRIPEALNKVASVLLKHMILLFVPASAGIMVQYTHIEGHWPAVVVAVLGSSALGLIVTAWVYTKLKGDA